MFGIFTDRFLWFIRQCSNLNSDVVSVEKKKWQHSYILLREAWWISKKIINDA